MFDFAKINRTYRRHLARFDSATSGGQERAIAGETFEFTIDKVCETIGLESIKGDFDYINPDIDGLTMDLQVDRHIFDDSGKRVAFVESKTYLDASFLKRAIFDLMEIASVVEDDNVKFGIFAGQNAVKASTMNYYLAFFQKMTGREVEVFFVNSGKRVSSRPISTNRFPLDRSEVERFANWLTA